MAANKAGAAGNKIKHRIDHPLPRNDVPLSFEKDESPVASVAALLVDPLPVRDVVVRFTGELPIKQVHALALVAPGFDHDVLPGSLAHALDLAHRVIKMHDRHGGNSPQPYDEIEPVHRHRPTGSSADRCRRGPFVTG